MNQPLTAQQYAIAITDPNILVSPVLENRMFSFDLNCNETISAYPDAPSPTSYPTFRQALALLTDKPYIVNVTWGGFAYRMDVPIPANAPTWLNTSVVYPHYPWECNFSRALMWLDSAGFVEGDTPNPYYDPEIPGSTEHIRTYPIYEPRHDNPHVGTDVTGPPYKWNVTYAIVDPVLDNIEIKIFDGALQEYRLAVYGVDWTYRDLGHLIGPYCTETYIEVTVDTAIPECRYIWINYNTTNPKATEDLDPIIFYAEPYRSEMLSTATHFSQLLRQIGIPVNFIPLYFVTPKHPVISDRNYHIYAGEHLLSRYPTDMYTTYHSSWWFPNGSNYVAPPCPRPSPGPSIIDPNYDLYLEQVYYANSIPSAIAASKKAQGIHVMEVVNIPICCPKSFYAWRSWLLGVVNEMGYGPINDYTFLNAYKATGAPEQNTIIVGMLAPSSLNILFAKSSNDYTILDRIWPKGQTVNPYDIGRDQPWIVQDWTPTTWVDPDDGLTKTACIYWLRKDVKWVEPVTGNYIRNFTAHDVEFSNMFLYAFPDSAHWINAKDVDHIEIVDNYTYVVYFSSESYWFQYAANYPYLPKYEWGALFCTNTTYTELGAHYSAGDSLYLTGSLVAQVKNITVDGALFTDYWVRFNWGWVSACSANRIYFLSDVSGDLVVNYWNITGDPHGYYPGESMGYDWTDTFFSIGTHVGDGGLLKRNDFFFLETPPLGEVDWYWWWGPRDTTRPLGGPRTGFFVVDIYDVTFATVSYGSTGYLEPTVFPPWFPGADLAPTYTPEVPYGGEIDIYDVSTILVSYGTEFGRTPLDP
jgi:ABC-type transport system substrate-binding protein